MTKSRMIESVVVALLIGGAVAAFAIIWRPAIAAISPPAPQAFDLALVKRGRDLAAIVICNDCHTVRGGKDFAGGLPVPTPFGTIFSSNITPDAETGIGQWPEAAFRRAMRSGVNRDGQHLYPAFPYDHFTNVTDEDDRALYAYLMTRQPVRAPARANQLPFPLDQRAVIAGWALLFLRGGRCAAPAILPEMCWARNAQARSLPAAMSTTGTPMRSTRNRPRPFHGMLTRCSLIFAMAGIPIMASRVGRWRRWSAIYHRHRKAISGQSRPIWPACSARRRRIANAGPRRCWRKPSRPPCRPQRPMRSVHRSTPRLARHATGPRGRCPMVGSISASLPLSAVPIRATPSTSCYRAFARWKASAARSCRALLPA